MSLTDVLFLAFLAITPLIYAFYFLTDSKSMNSAGVIGMSLAIGLLLLYFSVWSIALPEFNNFWVGDSEERSMALLRARAIHENRAVMLKPVGLTISTLGCVIWNLICYWGAYALVRYKKRSDITLFASSSSINLASIATTILVPMTFYIGGIVVCVMERPSTKQRPAPPVRSLIPELDVFDTEEPPEVVTVSPNEVLRRMLAQQDSEDKVASNTTSNPTQDQPSPETNKTPGESSEPKVNPAVAELKGLSPDTSIAKFFVGRIEGRETYNNVDARACIGGFESLTDSPNGAGYLMIKESNRLGANLPQPNPNEVGQEWTEYFPIRCELYPRSCMYMIYVPKYGRFDPDAKRALRHQLWTAAQTTMISRSKPDDGLALVIFSKSGWWGLATEEVLVSTFLPSEHQGSQQSESTADLPANVKRGTAEEILEFTKYRPAKEAAPTVYEANPPRPNLFEDQYRKQWMNQLAPIQSEPVPYSEVAKIFHGKSRLESNTFNSPEADRIVKAFRDKCYGSGGSGAAGIREAVQLSAKSSLQGTADQAYDISNPIHCELKGDSCVLLIYIHKYTQFTESTKKQIKDEFWKAAMDSAASELKAGDTLAVAIFHSAENKIMSNNIWIGQIRDSSEIKSEQDKFGRAGSEDDLLRLLR